MEFTQHLDDYEHAKCVELYGWKCYICCVEVKDQVGLEMQQIGDGIVYTDGIDGSKWICCQKCKKTYHLECVTIPTLFSVGPRQKTTAKKIRRGNDGRRIAQRKDESAGRNIKEQTCGRGTRPSLPEQRLSKNQIHKQTGVLYTHLYVSA